VADSRKGVVLQTGGWTTGSQLIVKKPSTYEMVYGALEFDGETSGMTLWTRQWKFGFHKRRGITWPSDYWLFKKEFAPWSYLTKAKVQHITAFGVESQKLHCLRFFNCALYSLGLHLNLLWTTNVGG